VVSSRISRRRCDRSGRSWQSCCLVKARFWPDCRCGRERWLRNQGRPRTRRLCALPAAACAIVIAGRALAIVAGTSATETCRDFTSTIEKRLLRHCGHLSYGYRASKSHAITANSRAERTSKKSVERAETPTENSERGERRARDKAS